MHPILFKIGDFPITSFGLMVCLGAIAGSFWLRRALAGEGLSKSDDPAGDLVTGLILWGLLGARLMYVAIHPESLRDASGEFQPLRIFALWQGGLVSFGGFFGGAFAVWRFTRKHRITYRRLGDAVAPGLFLGQSIGRVGCLLVGDDHGRPTDLPWAITFPYVMRDGMKWPAKEGCLIPPDALGVPLHPSQIYLSLMNLALFGILVVTFRRRRFDGQVMALGMMLYSVGRFSLEFTRGDDAARGIYSGLSTAQWLSIAAFATGAIAYGRFRSGARAAAA